MSMSLFTKLQLSRRYRIWINHPERTDNVFKIVDLVLEKGDPAVIRDLEERVLAFPRFRALFEARYLPPRLGPDRLRGHAPGTLGAEYLAHLERNGITPELFPEGRIERPVEYLSQRMYREHDLWHALLGYSISVEDELALQAFGFAQYHSPLSTMLIAGGILHLLKRGPQRAVAGFQGVIEGYARGKRARFLLELKLFEMLDLPLAEARARCGIADGAPAGADAEPEPSALALANA
jgi:ubiquinone biosynthesis protein COQ4